MMMMTMRLSCVGNRTHPCTHPPTHTPILDSCLAAAIDQPLDGRTSILVCDVSDDVLSLTIGRAPATGSGDDEAGNGGDDGSTGDAMDAGYITLTFTNECYAGTIVAAVMYDDEKMEDTEPNWVTDGFWWVLASSKVASLQMPVVCTLPAACQVIHVQLAGATN